MATISTENRLLDPSLGLYVPLRRQDGNICMSRDGYGHLITKTGTTWTPRGTSSDGIDDIITSSDISVGAAPQHFSIVLRLSILSFNDGIAFDTNSAKYASFWVSQGVWNGLLIDLVTAGYNDIRFNYGIDTDFHVWIMTFDNGLIKQYKDGILARTDDFTGDSVTATWTPTFHARTGGIYLSNCLISDGLIYTTRVLGAIEVANLSRDLGNKQANPMFVPSSGGLQFPLTFPLSFS